jgi:hypothetical protein
VTWASFTLKRRGIGTRDSSEMKSTQRFVLMTTRAASGKLPARNGHCHTGRETMALSPHALDAEAAFKAILVDIMHDQVAHYRWPVLPVIGVLPLGKGPKHAVRDRFLRLEIAGREKGSRTQNCTDTAQRDTTLACRLLGATFGSRSSSLQ